jgi:hypothetical protein
MTGGSLPKVRDLAAADRAGRLAELHAVLAATKPSTSKSPTSLCISDHRAAVSMPRADPEPEDRTSYWEFKSTVPSDRHPSPAALG